MMHTSYFSVVLCASFALCVVLTTISGQTCTVRSTVITITSGSASTALRTGTQSTSAGSASTTSGITMSTGITSASGTGPVESATSIATGTASTTTTSDSGTGPSTPLPAPMDTNANGVLIYGDRAVCGSIYETDSTDNYGIYCNSAFTSANILPGSPYSMNSDGTSVSLDVCVQSCTRYGDQCQGAVFYNGTSTAAPTCSLFAGSYAAKRSVQSTLTLTYAISSYAAFSMGTVDSPLPAQPTGPGSTSPPPPSNSTMRFVMKPRQAMKQRKALLDISYIH